MVCSNDGYCSFVQFEEGELGISTVPEEPTDIEPEIRTVKIRIKPANSKKLFAKKKIAIEADVVQVMPTRKESQFLSFFGKTKNKTQ